MNLGESIAVVTGGAQNIGLGIARTLAGKGSQVVILDKDAEKLAAIADSGLWACPCDVTDPASVSATLNLIVERHGRIDLLVNCAGWICSAPLYSLLTRPDGKHPLDLWNKAIAANLTSTFVMSSHVVERMARKRTKGLIVNISSIAAQGNAGQSAYTAAKAGVNAMTLAWAKELGPLGIRAVAIAPGFIDTESTRDALTPERLEEWIAKTPLRRLGTVSQIADTVVFAAENDYLSGTVIEVDGGLTL